MKRRIFDVTDWLCGLFAGGISLCVYVATAAPSVTLLDSGEFMTAAMHFGVPHPTGYPLWTILAWIFQLLPFGNKAWLINIFSGVCGALAVALVAMLIRNSIRWLMKDWLVKLPRLATLCALSCSLMFAFSFSMWSQAVIAEVYTLHALMIGLYLTSLYIWLHRPQRMFWLLASFFFFALSFSNHHLTIVFAILPLQLGAVLLVRIRIFWDLIFACLITVLLVYLEFAVLSQDIMVLKTAIRFFYCVAAAFAVFLYLRKLRVKWSLIAYLPVAILLGLLPYAYMPLASSTNPPMNWSYAREPAGFYYSINRSQYTGTLSEISLKSLGRAVGVNPPETATPLEKRNPLGIKPQGFFAHAQEWVGFFWLQLVRNFTPLCVFGYFAAIFVIFRIEDVARRTWIYILEIAFLTAAFLQPFTGDADIDVNGWWLEMPFHTYTNFIFGALCGIGFAYVIYRLFERSAKLAILQYALLALPLMPLYLNYDECSQRGRWFGWQFGHDILKDLPPNSVLYGGTDPGRFVPTYMIFGESFQDPSVKRDPSFDRRDLYIITQNALGEAFYMKYIGDHYGPNRPKPKNAFERWLKREKMYPEKPLILPTTEEMKDAIEQEAKRIEKETGTAPEFDEPVIYFGSVAKWIWEKNKDQHEFFVEESFKMPWTYDYALPEGLVYRLNKTKLEKVPEDVVVRDMAFWKEYTKQLLGNPLYDKDLDAKRSFSKLRMTSGHIYKHFKMEREARQAFAEAIALWPGNIEAIMGLSYYLWENENFDGVIALFDNAILGDPNNMDLWRLKVISENRKVREAEIKSLQTLLADNPKSRDTLQKLLDLYGNVGETNKAKPLLEQGLKDFSSDADFLRYAIGYYDLNKQPKLTLAPAQQLVAIDESNPRNHYLLARAWFAQSNNAEFYKAAARSMELGGLPAREVFQNDPFFAPLRNEEEFKNLMNPQAVAPKK